MGGSFPTASVIGTAIAGPIGAAIGSGIDSSNAQQRIASAQEDEQRSTRAQAVAAATPSASEISQLESAISLNSTDISRRQALLASADPAMIAAGEQTLKLLNGTDAAVLAPLKNQQALQRKTLEAKLQSQLGSGYATTTAGSQALAQFDQAANADLASAQSQSLAQLLGTTANISNTGYQTQIQNASSLSQLYGAQGSRMVNAINGTPITTAGSGNVGALASSQQIGALSNSLIGAGTTLATAGLLGGRSTAATNSAASSATSSAYQSPLAGSIFG